MKKPIIFLLILLFPFLFSNCKKNKTDDTQYTLHTENFNEFYNYVPELIIPYSWMDSQFNFKRTFEKLPLPFYHYFLSENTTDSLYIAKLPVISNFKPILVNRQGNTMANVELYILSDSLQALDKAILASEEKINKKTKILQTFIVIDKNQFQTFKQLNKILIEQLNYTIDKDGKIIEIRDGKQITFAYENYKDSIYMVESFKWDRNKNGGLFKKDRTEKVYILKEDGEVIERSSK